jgi:heptosyltransferase-2
MMKAAVCRSLILSPNWLGDVIMAQPAMRAIARHDPSMCLFVSGRPWLRDLLPFLDLGTAQYCEELRQAQADEVYIFRNSFSAAWQAFRARIPRRHGFAHDGRSCLLRPAYQPHFNMAHDHHRRYFLDLVRQAGIPAEQDEPVALRVTDEQRQAARDLVIAHGLDPQRLICVAPGAQFGAAKRYPDLSYRMVLQTLSEAGWHMVVLGMKEESAIADSCLQACTGPSWNSCGQTSLSQALQLLTICQLLVCNDSGLMHVAAGMGRAVVAMFGATAPERTAPSGDDVRLLYHPASCSPCLQRECTVSGHPCMSNISPAEVTEHCLAVLRERA